MDTKQRRLIADECERQGYHIEITKWPARLTYYKPVRGRPDDGEAMLGLPSDPVTMLRYFNKGFTLKPPEKPKVDGTGSSNDNDLESPTIAVHAEIPALNIDSEVFKCSECGFIAKSRIGLISHQRKHTRKEVRT